jgi:hypothetical protein
MRCTGSSLSSCICTRHHPFGCLGCVLDMCVCQGNVACSAPLEPAHGCHLTHSSSHHPPHSPCIPLHFPDDFQVVILASPLLTCTLVCGTYTAAASLVCPAIFILCMLIRRAGVTLLASPPQAKQCMTFWACLVRVCALWLRMSALALMPGIVDVVW